MKLVELIGLLQVLACDARLVVASNTVSDDYAYDLSSPVYVALKAQLRRLRAENKPLRLKINSHPCAGKSYFIFKHKVGTGRKAPLEASFMGCQLYDFDDYVGAQTDIAMLSTQVECSLALLSDLPDGETMLGTSTALGTAVALFPAIVPKGRRLEVKRHIRVSPENGCGGRVGPN